MLFREADGASVLPGTAAEPVDAETPDGHADAGEPAPKPTSIRSRLLNLDLMRGYFVLILAAVHLDYVPSLFGWFDGRGALWVSEAEGFFFISGMLVAMMRRRDFQKGGLGLAVRRSWRRAWQLYAVACTLTIFYTILGRIAVANGLHGVKVGLDEHESWPHLLVRTLTLNYVYGWADFLTFYVPMFLVAPFAVWALMRKLDVLVLVLSLAAYASLTWHADGSITASVQWQAYFFTGAVIGFHFEEIKAWFGGMRRRTRVLLAALAVSAAAAIYAAGLLMLFHFGIHHAGLYDKLLGNNRLGLIRPVLAVIMFAGGYVALEYLQRPIMATVGRLLQLFGQNSLYVYIVQSLLVFVVPFVLKPQGVLVNTALDFTIIALVWLGLKTNFLTKYIPR